MSYHTIDDILHKTDAPIDAAEAHGIATGLLCIECTTPTATWLDEISCTAGSIPEQDYAMLTALFEQTQQLLADNNFEFDLFLPDQDCPLADRAAALKNWCRGFLFGVGFARSETKWPGDTGEILKDIIEFSKIDTDAGGEEDENALVEIIEYLRAAIMLFYEEFNDHDSPSRQLH